LINKILELSGKKDLSAKAGEMILKNVSMPDGLIRGDNRKTLLMFMTSGCRMCRESEDIIKKNIEIQLYKDVSYAGSIYIKTNDYGLTWKYDEFLDNGN
jgi:hypothetical protein